MWKAHSWHLASKSLFKFKESTNLIGLFIHDLEKKIAPDFHWFNYSVLYFISTLFYKLFMILKIRVVSKNFILPNSVVSKNFIGLLINDLEKKALYQRIWLAYLLVTLKKSCIKEFHWFTYSWFYQVVLYQRISLVLWLFFLWFCRARLWRLGNRLRQYLQPLSVWTILKWHQQISKTIFVI